MKNCPYCAEEIQDAAVVCKHCRRDLPPTGPALSPYEQSLRPAHPTSTQAAPSSTAPKTGLKASNGCALGCLTVIVGIALLAVIGYIAGPSSPSPSMSSPTPTRAETSAIRLGSRELIIAYTQNEIAADQKYKGELLEVTGPIDTIGKDILNNPYITLGDGDSSSFRSVQAMFSKGDEGQLSVLSKRQIVTVRCRGKGLMMNVQLGSCVLVRS